MNNPENDNKNDYWKEEEDDGDEKEEVEDGLDTDDEDDDEKKSIILCVTVEDMPEITDAEKSKCTHCNKDVWIKEETKTNAEEPGLPIEICCNKCFLDGKIDLNKVIVNAELKQQVVKAFGKITKDFRRTWR